MNSLQPLIAQHQTGKLRVLLVDDDDNITDALGNLLEDSGYDVDISPCVADALEKLQRKTFSILLTDYSLPDGNGLDLAAQAKRRQSWMELILITGHDILQLRPLPQAADVKVDFLRKPVQLETLIQALEHAAHRQRDKLQIPILQPEVVAEAAAAIASATAALAPSARAASPQPVPAEIRPALPVETPSPIPIALPDFWLPEHALSIDGIGWRPQFAWVMLILVGFGSGWLTRGILGKTPGRIHTARAMASRPHLEPRAAYGSLRAVPSAKVEPAEPPSQPATSPSAPATPPRDVQPGYDGDVMEESDVSPAALSNSDPVQLATPRVTPDPSLH